MQRRDGVAVLGQVRRARHSAVPDAGEASEREGVCACLCVWWDQYAYAVLCMYRVCVRACACVSKPRKHTESAWGAHLLVRRSSRSLFVSRSRSSLSRSPRPASRGLLLSALLSRSLRLAVEMRFSSLASRTPPEPSRATDTRLVSRSLLLSRSSLPRTGERSLSLRTGERSLSLRTGERSFSLRTGERSPSLRAGDLSLSLRTGERSLSRLRGGERSFASFRAGSGDFFKSARRGETGSRLSSFASVRLSSRSRLGGERSFSLRSLSLRSA